eukprot:GGOE01002625.1.p1 GENE.GGOE01002625.1~~GGOE01002625.1.p1  ORF type:complete len:227 (-),score=72.45 GGOE01002625.1:264-944(-)
MGAWAGLCWRLEFSARSYRFSFPGAYFLIAHHAAMVALMATLSALLVSGCCTLDVLDWLQAGLLLSGLLEMLSLFFSYGGRVLPCLAELCDCIQLVTFLASCGAIAAFQDAHRGPRYGANLLGTTPAATDVAAATTFALCAMWETFYIFHVKSIAQMENINLEDLCHWSVDIVRERTALRSSSLVRSVFQSCPSDDYLRTPDLEEATGFSVVHLPPANHGTFAFAP